MPNRTQLPPDVLKNLRQLSLEKGPRRELDMMLFNLGQIPMPVAMAAKGPELGVEAMSALTKRAGRTAAPKAAKEMIEKAPAVAEKFAPLMGHFKMQLAELERLFSSAQARGDEAAMRRIAQLQKLIGGTQGAMAPSWGKELGGVRFEPMFRRVIGLANEEIANLRTADLLAGGKGATPAAEAPRAASAPVDWEALSKKFKRPGSDLD